jgi:nucleoside recognition membrane protein YjiH
MLQRKQSLWLLLASLISVLTFFIPFGIRTDSAIGSSTINETLLTANGNLILTLLSSSISICALGCIFLFSNRKLQMRVTWVIILLCIITAAFMVYDGNFGKVGNRLVVGLLGEKIYVGLLVPILSLFFTIIAFLGIRADEKLIKSMDRLR